MDPYEGLALALAYQTPRLGQVDEIRLNVETDALKLHAFKVKTRHGESISIFKITKTYTNMALVT